MLRILNTIKKGETMVITTQKSKFLGLFLIQSLLLIIWTSKVVNSQVIASANTTIVFAFCITSSTREKGWRIVGICGLKILDKLK